LLPDVSDRDVSDCDLLAEPLDTRSAFLAGKERFSGAADTGFTKKVASAMISRARFSTSRKLP
jgi:hypothetical protein